MRLPRKLQANERVSCFLGPALAAAVFVAARVLLPFAQRSPWLGHWFPRGCLLKALTGVPCPFCGATRATILAARGAWLQSLLLSPLGVALIGVGPLVGLWLGLCALSGRDLGLSTGGKFLKAAGPGAFVLGCLAGLWAYKIFLDCVLRVGG